MNARDTAFCHESDVAKFVLLHDTKCGSRRVGICMMIVERVSWGFIESVRPARTA